MKTGQAEALAYLLARLAQLVDKGVLGLGGHSRDDAVAGLAMVLARIGDAVDWE